MRLICPKCKGMKKFYVGIPVSRKCGDHPSVNLIHVNAEIDMPADPVEELPEKEEKLPVETAISILPDLGVDVLRNMARDLKIKNWWILSKAELIADLTNALEAEHATDPV